MLSDDNTCPIPVSYPLQLKELDPALLVECCTLVKVGAALALPTWFLHTPA